MNDWRYDPNVQHVTHSDRLGTYEELQVRSGSNVGVPAEQKPKPTEAFAAIRAQFGAQFDAMDPAPDRRELPPLTYAERNDARFDALWLAVQALASRVEVLEQARDPAQSDVWEVVALARRISTLEATVSAQAGCLAALEHAGKPLAMAEDAWGVG